MINQIGRCVSMVGKYKVITLCGSTRFKNAFIDAQKRLTLEENIVISVGLFGHSGDSEALTEGTREMLDDMHKRKIDMADEIFVINVGGYIGPSTQSEIEYAQANGKAVRYLEATHDCFIPNINIDEAFANLDKRRKDIGRYKDIMSMAKQPADSFFQKKYNAFYRVRRNEGWRKEYYRIFEFYSKRKNVSFGEILLRLQQATGQIEASFASKMLATLNTNMPIWDSNVLKVLQLSLKGNVPELKMSNAVVLYDRICRWYKEFLQTIVAKELLQRFDKEFPEYKSLSDVKKIDFILWASK